ncbi:MAG: hypothetical protein DMG26_21295 [Acidobacteria bacterium]|nr:MAG: hypothetical protein DMG26_21295 [Acidobacteriota bacterium]
MDLVHRLFGRGMPVAHSDEHPGLPLSPSLVILTLSGAKRKNLCIPLRVNSAKGPHQRFEAALEP